MMKSKITLDIAELLGALSGDGFIGNYGDRKQQFIIQFSGHVESEEDYFKYLENIMRKKFPELNFSYRTRNKTLILTTYSKDLFNFLSGFEFPSGKKGNLLKIPTVIKQDDKLTRAFIRGLFDTDGCLFFDKRKTYKKPYPRILLEITSHKLFKEVSDYLRNHFKLTTKKRLRGRFEIYLLEIYGRRQLNKWLEIIGFSNKKQLKKICPCSSVVARQNLAAKER